MAHPYKYKFEQDVVLLADLEDIEPYTFRLPDPPPWETITNYGLPPKEQFFQYEVMPLELKKIDRLVSRKKMSVDEARKECIRHRELAEYIEGQWKKRKHGDWQFIKGQLFYIPPAFWNYLNYNPINIKQNEGRPYFRLPDLEEELWWKFCVEDNQVCYGGILFTRRRVGKTGKAGNRLRHHATMNKLAWSGIQSKNDDDAKDVFDIFCTYQNARVPFFFRPSGKGTKDEVLFSHEDVAISLESRIDYKSSVAKAYDGKKLTRYLLDECGKMTPPMNPIEIWDKVRPCFWESGIITGKALLTTTVEDMERGGGGEFNWLWLNSSRRPADQKINEFGQTLTGLVPFFISSYRNTYFDQWGFPIVETPEEDVVKWRIERGEATHIAHVGAKEFIDGEIAALSGKNKIDLIRKQPRNIREAFQFNNKDVLFDIEIINEALKSFVMGYPTATRKYHFGYFMWEEEKFGRVKWVEVKDDKHPQCRFIITHLPEEEQANKWIVRSGKKHPANTALYSGGADPFKLPTEQITNKRDMSLGAGHIWGFLNTAIDPIGKPRAEWVTDNFVLEYNFRPPTPDEFSEDMLMACIYYGCKTFPEFNVNVMDSFFRQHGFENYLQHRAKLVNIGTGAFLKEVKNQSGGITNDAFKPQLIRHGINYIIDKGLYCPFKRTLEHMRDMSYSEWNDFDLGVSALYTLYGAHDHTILSRGHQEKKRDFSDLNLPRARSSWGK